MDEIMAKSGLVSTANIDCAGVLRRWLCIRR